ncbi:MAG: serine hydrolase domain-containing protein [Acidobacteriota bacterium]
MNRKAIVDLVAVVFAAAGSLACSSPGTPRASGAEEAPVAERRFPQLDREVPQLLATHKAAGVGIGVLEGGELVWTGYYGEQGPGVPASADTVFNTASVAKSVTAEVMMALASEGLLSLDEPISAHLEHPSLSGDPRYALLTPRLLRSHRAGLRNWPYEYPNQRPTFIARPGNAFSYSGMGIEMAAQFAENKLGEDFEALAKKYVFGPAGIQDMSLGRRRAWMQGRLATPMNAEGEYVEIDDGGGRLAGVGEDGPWSGADDLLTTVEAYAQFLAGVLDDRWVSEAMAAERRTILTSLRDNDIWGCPAVDAEPGGSDNGVEVPCASHFGHSLGWMVYRFPDKTVVKHGGNDFGENALAIYSVETGDGAIILVNGGNGIFVSTQILGLLGQQPEIAAYYRRLVRKFYGVELAAPTIDGTASSRSESGP